MGKEYKILWGLPLLAVLAGCEPVSNNPTVTEKCILVPPGYVLPYDKWSPYPICEMLPDAVGLAIEEEVGGTSSRTAETSGTTTTSSSPTAATPSSPVSEAVSASARDKVAGAASIGADGVSEVSTAGDTDGDGESDGATATSGDTTSSANARDLL